MKTLEPFDNLMGYISSINDERDVIPLLLALKDLWPKLRDEIIIFNVDKEIAKLKLENENLKLQLELRGIFPPVKLDPLRDTAKRYGHHRLRKEED